MTANVAVQLTGVSVCYRLPHERISGLKEFVIRWIQRRMQYEELWALKDVNLSVRQGETYGIIGSNGAGKTTLLRVVARILEPATGRVIVRGRVAPLLALGAGFHPELTGRENAYIFGVLLGQTRQGIRERMHEIAEFAGVQEFLDVPLRMYSSGMWVRLGFAIATSVRPDILIVDEVFAVGDRAFQRKCLQRMDTFRAEGTTTILVSHDLNLVESRCDEVLWIEEGLAKSFGPATAVVDAYRS